MAQALADAQIPAVFSYAGRTEHPVAQPLPTRVGGFGGVEGLVAYLRAQTITHVIDATHPFAAQMSANAVAACTATGTPLIALERAPWVAVQGDRWTIVPDIAAAVAALPEAPSRVFLAIGRQHLEAFAARPRHHYLLRLVDQPTGALPLPNATIIVARGPFDADADRQLLEDHRVHIVVAKNAGGDAARAKIDAARALGLRVIMIDRPPIPDRQRAETVTDVMHWLGHRADLGV